MSNVAIYSFHMPAKNHLILCRLWTAARAIRNEFEIESLKNIIFLLKFATTLACSETKSFDLQIFHSRHYGYNSENGSHRASK